MPGAKHLGLTRDHLRRIVEVAHAHHLGFVELVGLADLDPATAFRGSTIRGTALRGEDLAGFDLTGATLAGCDLRGADLSRSAGITEAMLAEAILDPTTKLPPSSRSAFWATGHPPSWADDWGHDEHGPWVSFRVPGTAVTQRMRWIPPGQFMMGSPAKERGRFYNEGPPHPVTIARGFWMFETACTAALWTAVTSASPRHQEGPEFPVTQVSWDDAQNFVRRLNVTLPGLGIGLPSEAEWEYACRAGTQTPYNFGSRISEKLVRYASNGPVEVGNLPPNAWGLREMHGNVWEWCEDHLHSSYDGAPSDGSAWQGDHSAARRVVRGGSWFAVAGLVRAACRGGSEPGDRNGSLGFRCVRGHLSSEAACEPRGAGRGERRARSGPAAAAGPTRRAGAERSDGPAPHTPHRPNSAPEKPPWASATGSGQYGTYAEISLPDGAGGVVTQRLRLIQPGRFMMGSPPREPGRYKHEGPCHAVTMKQAFWLFDTPCTQMLWQAIMGGNPSQLKSPTRPVESVSFEDVQRFLTRVNHSVPGLNLILPSEARWEYACRAGTKTATYAGPIEIVGQNNAPALDRMSWYGGNSGVGYELEGGYDSNAWPEKQYPFAITGTRPVKGKAPNDWGLYDMLGNVNEWCEDTWHESYAGAPADGAAWVSGRASGRVVRGGSWYDDARDVRAASREWYTSTDGFNFIGFRCAREQD